MSRRVGDCQAESNCKLNCSFSIRWSHFCCKRSLRSMKECQPDTAPERETCRAWFCPCASITRPTLGAFSGPTNTNLQTNNTKLQPTSSKLAPNCETSTLPPRPINQPASKPASQPASPEGLNQQPCHISQPVYQQTSKPASQEKRICSTRSEVSASPPASKQANQPVSPKGSKF